MVQDWLNDDDRTIFDAGMSDMLARRPGEYGASFDQLDVDTQVAIMEDMVSAASDSPWFELGNVQRQFMSDAPFICQVKELTVWGFFTSEVGSKEVLRYNPMPMYFDGDSPLGPDDSSWAGRLEG
mgnify:FL=1